MDAVAHGNAALDHFQDTLETSGFDLILLDLMMPGVHGLDFCRYLRRRGFTTPILIVSAKDWKPTAWWAWRREQTITW